MEEKGEGKGGGKGLGCGQERSVGARSGEWVSGEWGVGDEIG